MCPRLITLSKNKGRVHPNLLPPSATTITPATLLPGQISCGPRLNDETHDGHCTTGLSRRPGPSVPRIPGAFTQSAQKGSRTRWMPRTPDRSGRARSSRMAPWAGRSWGAVKRGREHLARHQPSLSWGTAGGLTGGGRGPGSLGGRRDPRESIPPGPRSTRQRDPGGGARKPRSRKLRPHPTARPSPGRDSAAVPRTASLAFGGALSPRIAIAGRHCLPCPLPRKFP